MPADRFGVEGSQPGGDGCWRFDADPAPAPVVSPAEGSAAAALSAAAGRREGSDLKPQDEDLELLEEEEGGEGQEEEEEEDAKEDAEEGQEDGAGDSAVGDAAPKTFYINSVEGLQQLSDCVQGGGDPTKAPREAAPAKGAHAADRIRKQLQALGVQVELEAEEGGLGWDSIAGYCPPPFNKNPPKEFLWV